MGCARLEKPLPELAPLAEAGPRRMPYALPPRHPERDQHRPSERVFFLGIGPIQSGSGETARNLVPLRQIRKRYGLPTAAGRLGGARRIM